jgi:hypothetical protein
MSDKANEPHKILCAVRGVGQRGARFAGPDATGERGPGAPRDVGPGVPSGTATPPEEPAKPSRRIRRWLWVTVLIVLAAVAYVILRPYFTTPDKIDDLGMKVVSNKSRWSCPTDLADTLIHALK